MIEMNLGYKCKHSKACQLYNGSEIQNNTPLHLLRNVFCNRGHKGWKNCKQYNAFEEAQTEVNTQDK